MSNEMELFWLGYVSGFMSGIGIAFIGIAIAKAIEAKALSPSPPKIVGGKEYRRRDTENKTDRPR